MLEAVSRTTSDRSRPSENRSNSSTRRLVCVCPIDGLDYAPGSTLTNTTHLIETHDVLIAYRTSGMGPAVRSAPRTTAPSVGPVSVPVFRSLLARCRRPLRVVARHDDNTFADQAHVLVQLARKGGLGLIPLRALLSKSYEQVKLSVQERKNREGDFITKTTCVIV
jgi:hypothetical protein